MAYIDKTKKGWLVSITNMVNGMLEQGGMAGRKVLVPTAKLEELGIPYDTEPAMEWNDWMSVRDFVIDYAAHNAPGCKVIRTGWLIQ